jgi:phosphatidylglycerol---prolipoprotein diacylglyceryl transferase
MIPYISTTGWQFGPFFVQSWGLLIALGVLVGAFAAGRYAKSRGLKPQIIWDAVVWVLLGAMVAGRLFHIVFYDLGYYLENPFEVFAVWHGGLSIMGGFIGALIVGVLFLCHKKVDVWRYAEAMVFGLPFGLFVGRIGCFLIHDHPGKVTDFILGVQYPDGLVRHDHGLYLSLNGLVMFLVFVGIVLAKKKIKRLVFIPTFLVWYGVVRFFLDFLRATDGVIIDERYLGLTPAQYVSLCMVLAGIWIFAKKPIK